MTALFSGCQDELEYYRLIDDIHYLENRNIGILNSYSPDCFLSSRNHCILFRFSDIGSLVLELTKFSPKWYVFSPI